MPTPWITTILTQSETLPDSEKVFEVLRQTPGYTTLDFEWLTREPMHFVFRTPYATLAVTLTEKVEDERKNIVPPAQLIEASRRAWHWAEAALQLPKIKRQIVVAVLAEDGELDEVDTALLLTALTRAVLSETQAVMVYWNASGMLHEPVTFAEHAAEINRQTLPVELWVDFRLKMHEDHSVSLGTWGLERFGLSELEVIRTSRELPWVMRWMFNVSHFLLENGAILEEGHTFGSSEEEKFTVHLCPSAPEVARQRPTRVLQLCFEEDQNQNPKNL